MRQHVAIALGSNLGNRCEYLREAVRRLIDGKILHDVHTSAYYETEAIVLKDSPADWNRPYINAVLIGKTSLSPRDLLNELFKIEITLDRDRSAGKWAPRTIDLDLLLYGNPPNGWVLSDDPELTLPHPRILERPFVLTPLAQLAPDWIYPNGSGMPLHAVATQSPKLTATDAGVLWPQFVGVVNITPDSFSDGGQFDSPEKALEQALKLTKEGASVIELGACATNPRAEQPADWHPEWARLEPALKVIVPALRALDAPPKISIDTYFAKTARLALEHFEVDWISDVQPQPDPHLLAMCSEARCTYVNVHTLSIPANNKKECLPANCNPVEALEEWGLERIGELHRAGIANVILDLGLGFGKTPAQSRALLQNAKRLADTWDVPVMLGHSRKGFVRPWVTMNDHSDIESAVLATQIEDFPYFLRTHTVSLHKKAFVSKMNTVAYKS